MPHSPSLLSGTSKSTRAVKKVAKSVGKAVKKGAAAISRPFKKRRKLSSESVGTFVFFSVVAKFLTYILQFLTTGTQLRRHQLGTPQLESRRSLKSMPVMKKDLRLMKLLRKNLVSIDFYVIFSLTNAIVPQNV
jgi:hypothetical protein